MMASLFLEREAAEAPVGSVKGSVGSLSASGGEVGGGGAAGVVLGSAALPFPFLPPGGLVFPPLFCLLPSFFCFPLFWAFPPAPLPSFVVVVAALAGSVAAFSSAAPSAAAVVAGKPISLKRVSISGSVRGDREVAISANVLPVPLRWRMAISSAVVHGVGGVGSAGAVGVGVGEVGFGGSGEVVGRGGLRRCGWWVGG